MFLQKIQSGQSGLLTYGITPPKTGTAPERVAEIAERTTARLIPLNIDALIVYDVQDESARTAVDRPFPFLQALDPLMFARDYLQELKIPKIIYRPAGKYSNEELSDWVDELQLHDFYPVFVGIPAPDYPVKTSLPEAYRIWSRHKESSVLGAVTIPERHEVLRDEEVRILDKVNAGASYFISQCVFNVAYVKRMVEDLHRACTKENKSVPTLIFTLAACGSPKTLVFMEWLGIHIPEELKEDLHKAGDMLEKSVNVCLDIAAEITAFCMARSIPFGFNIESVAIRKEEIEASVFMVNKVAELFEQQGIRKKKAVSVSPVTAI